MRLSKQPLNVIKRATAILGESAPLRGVMYLSLSAGILEAANTFAIDPADPYANMHVPALPGIIALTYAFARLRREDHATWQRRPGKLDLRHFAQGAALGSATILSVLGIAAAKGWVSAPAWGWDQSAPNVVVSSTTFLIAQQIALVWNEEMVFRGYGFDTLRTAFGLPAAAIIVTALFGVYHGLSIERAIGTAIGGVALLLMRLGSGSLWMPFGFHLMWNVLQVAVFGPADAAPSLRPLHLHGPEAWIGRPGSPEHGWLSMAVRTLVCVALLMWVRRAVPRGEVH